MENIAIQPAGAAHYDRIRKLFREYARELDIDLGFQDFEAELQEIEQQYGPPGGGLLLVLADGEPVGCVGVRALDGATAELKRMYLKPAYRAGGLGKRLLEEAVALARSLGYRTLRLDSLPGMTRAIALYKSAGFVEIPPYRYNPVEGAIFLELTL